LFQENKSFGASYHLHSSSDVREAMSRTETMLGEQYTAGKRLCNERGIRILHKIKKSLY
jgi:hypothetical protein